MLNSVLNLFGLEWVDEKPAASLSALSENGQTSVEQHGFPNDPTTELPEGFVLALSRYLVGYPQHVKAAYYFEMDGTLSLGLVASAGEINPDWMEVSFIPYLEGLLEAHMADFPGELTLQMLDEAPECLTKVVHRIKPFYQAELSQG